MNLNMKRNFPQSHDIPKLSDKDTQHELLKTPMW